MMRHAIVLLVALGFVAVAFSVLPAARASADLTAWAVGDSWTYVGYGFHLPLFSHGTYRFDVAGTDSILENGASVSAFHVEIWTNTTNTSLYHAADEWYRMSDLAPVRLSLNTSFCFIGFLPGGSCANGTSIATAVPPLSLHFPLTPGDHWSTSALVTYEQVNLDNGTSRWFNGTGYANDSVGSDVQVAVPAGNFTATPLTENYSLAATLFSLSYGELVVREYSPAVGNEVEETDYLTFNPHTGSPGLVPFAHMELVSYTLAPPWYDLKVLGIPLWTWLIGVAAASLVVTALLVRRWRRKAAPTPPADMPQADVVKR